MNRVGPRGQPGALFVDVLMSARRCPTLCFGAGGAHVLPAAVVQTIFANSQGRGAAVGRIAVALFCRVESASIHWKPFTLSLSKRRASFDKSAMSPLKGSARTGVPISKMPIQMSMEMPIQ